MQTYRIQEMLGFILRAKASTYVGGGLKLLPYRLGSHDLQYMEGDWAYHDSYLGENDFIGEEAVYYRGKVVWAMNYFGRILRPDRHHLRTGRPGDPAQPVTYVCRRPLPGWVRTSGRVTLPTLTPIRETVTFFTGREVITHGAMKLSTSSSTTAGLSKSSCFY